MNPILFEYENEIVSFKRFTTIDGISFVILCAAKTGIEIYEIEEKFLKKAKKLLGTLGRVQ